MSNLIFFIAGLIIWGSAAFSFYTEIKFWMNRTKYWFDKYCELLKQIETKRDVAENPDKDDWWKGVIK